MKQFAKQIYFEGLGVCRRINFLLGVAYNRAESRVFDLREGVDTAGKTAMRDLDVDADAAVHGTGFQSINERHFRTVIEALDFPASSVLIDIGSGKGKVALLASEYPFARVVGVEISASLCAIAARNVDRWKRRKPISAPIEIVRKNALEYEFSDENIVVLNNPFDSTFLALFLQRMKESLRDVKRPVWLLYCNPAKRSIIDKDSLFVEERTFRFFGPGRDIAVYRIERSHSE